MLTGSCFWKMQAFMQSLQMRWPVPGHIGLSIMTIASAPSASPSRSEQVHLGDVLVERAAVERDAERVLLHRAVLLVDRPRRARVLLALVAEEAVVDFLEPTSRGHAPIGQPEAVAPAPLHFRPGHLFGQLGARPLDLDQPRVVERFGHAQRRPSVVAVVAGMHVAEMMAIRFEGDRGARRSRQARDLRLRGERLRAA